MTRHVAVLCARDRLGVSCEVARVPLERAPSEVSRVAHEGAVYRLRGQFPTVVEGETCWVFVGEGSR